VYTVSETAQVELRSGRVRAHAHRRLHDPLVRIRVPEDDREVALPRQPIPRASYTVLVGMSNGDMARGAVWSRSLSQ